MNIDEITRLRDLALHTSKERKAHDEYVRREVQLSNARHPGWGYSDPKLDGMAEEVEALRLAWVDILHSNVELTGGRSPALNFYAALDSVVDLVDQLKSLMEKGEPNER